MTTAINTLLEDLVKTARSRGITQAELARRAGLTPVGLSKAVHRGDVRASTLARLAAVLDMDLALVPSWGRQQAAEAIRAGRFFDLDEEDG